MQRDLRSALERQELPIHYHPVVDVATGAAAAGSRPCCAGVACCCPSISWWRRRRRRASCASRPGCCARPAPRPDGGGRATGSRSGSPSTSPRRSSCAAELAADLRAALDAGGFPGAALDLEVSEETLLCDASAVAAAFGAVNALGVGVVLDRFGIGHGSITALRRFRLRAAQARCRPDLGHGSGDGGVPARAPRAGHRAGPTRRRHRRGDGSGARASSGAGMRGSAGWAVLEAARRRGGGRDPHARRGQPPLPAAGPVHSGGSTPSAPSP